MSEENYDFGVRVELLVDEPMIHENLERIGIVNKQDKIIYPSCYLRKQQAKDGTDEYVIVHFKELFALQGKPSTFNKLDAIRRNTIVYCLQKWNLVKAINPEDISQITKKKIDVIKHCDKSQYQIIHKFRHNRQ
jgi:hypothetical protein